MSRARKGFALLAAIFVIVLLGALATAMVFAAGEESRASAGKLGATRALAAAEDVLTNTIFGTDWVAAMQLRAGQQIAPPPAAQAGVAVKIVRLDTTCFFLQAITTDPFTSPVNGRIVRRVGLTIEVVADSAGVLRPLRVPNRGWVELF